MHASTASSKAHRLRRALAALAVGVVVAAVAVISAPAADAAQTYQVTIDGPAESPMTGEPFLVTGTVTPAADGSTVRLQRYYAGRFHTIAKTTLDGSSTYQFAQVYGTVGGRTFRVTKSAEHRTDAGVSPMRRVFVTGSSVSSTVVLKSGNGLISARGSYQLTLLSTGDLVLTLTSTGRVVWSFGTAGHPGATAVLQRDGNLVVHDSAGRVVKTTDSGGHPAGTYALTMREDSDLNISDPHGALVWSNRTANNQLQKFEYLRSFQFLRSADRQYQLVMQKGGDLVLIDTSDGTVRWESGTSEPNSETIMGPGGALAVYGPRGRELWSTNTSGHPGAYAFLGNDGTLVLYQKGVAIWSSEGLGGALGDDYPANLRNADRDSIIDPWRFYNRECTSFVAWRMNSANHVDFQNFMQGGRWGSAYNWDDNARALGYRVDTVPARGAIAQSDREGHVAWVASVGDGVVTIEDYNYSGPGDYGVRTVPTSTYIYIHVKDL